MGRSKSEDRHAAAQRKPPPKTLWAVIALDPEDHRVDDVGLSLWSSREEAERAILEDAQALWDDDRDNGGEPGYTRPTTFEEAITCTPGAGDGIDIREVQVSYYAQI